MKKLLVLPCAEEGRRTVILMSEEENRVFKNGQPCTLTAQEYRLLLVLARSGGVPLSRDSLLCLAWDYQSPGKSRTVDVHVQRLRRKLGSSLLETVHGIGYKLCARTIPS